GESGPRRETRPVQADHDTHESESTPTLIQDIRLIFATILTDPGSSLAYGADALVAVTLVLVQRDYNTGMTATFIGGGIVMGVYFIAILVYNSMTRHHVHRVLGGGAFVSSHITSEQIRTPWLKRTVQLMGRAGTASLLSDFPATQAISLIAGVEALYFIEAPDRFGWAMVFLIGLSIVQRYGLGNLARYMIWPVLAFYISNLGIQLVGISMIATNGWTPPTLHAIADDGISYWPLIFAAVANGATLITGVEVGYSSVNFPHHKGKAIRISMWLLYGIVLTTYSLQLINFMGLGINQLAFPIDESHKHLPPVPIQIASHIGGDMLAIPFGLLTAIMLLLAAQTAQSDFPLEILRASRSNFFPRGIGDTAWKRTVPAPLIGGHEGVYNPRATLLLGALSIVILYFFPHSHDIESMYGLAVVTAMCIDIASYLMRQIRVKKVSPLTVTGLIIMIFMFGNILYNKFFDGAWFIVVLMVIYMIVFLFSEAVYNLWTRKINIVPLELGLWYPLFQNHPVDEKNLLLVSKFHPGVVHFLKNYARGGRMPLVVHFDTDDTDTPTQERPDWFRVINVPAGRDTITAITRYIQQHKPERVHLIPLLVRGMDPIKHYYFGNSIERLKHAISQFTDLQVEYNRERVSITMREVLHEIFPFLKYRHLKKNRNARRGVSGKSAGSDEAEKSRSEGLFRGRLVKSIQQSMPGDKHPSPASKKSRKKSAKQIRESKSPQSGGRQKSTRSTSDQKSQKKKSPRRPRNPEE
ncbi:MAG: APC family permease, partial [Leptospiraceae bacterium]|nr:APC family permease [Leptospiraceae bacterium]